MAAFGYDSSSLYPDYNYQQQQLGMNFDFSAAHIRLLDQGAYNGQGSLTYIKENTVKVKKGQFVVVALNYDNTIQSSHDTIEEAESAAARLASSSDFEYAVLKQTKIFRKKPVDVESIEVTS